jgi:hypothetical protein
LVFLLTLVGLIVPNRPASADETTDAVARLYVTAAYDETLASLDRLDYQQFGEIVDEYRALCFLALNREHDAEAAMESLVRRRPQPLDDLSARPPKFAGLYRSVRTRLIPSVATALYNRGKASLERRDYQEAAAAFAAASALVSGEESGALSDLRLLADEFRSLSEQQIRRAQAPVLPEAALATSLPLPSLPPPPPPREFLPIARVYGPTDPDVRAPIVIDQTLPAWHPPKGFSKGRVFHGALKLVVNEHGGVESTEITQRSFLPYDEQLLRTAREWRYRPAMKGNHAVRYSRIIEFTLQGDASSE